MKKQLALLLVLLLAAIPVNGLWTPKAQAAYSFIGGGVGSETDPYVIMTAEDLDHVRDNLTASYRLGADIDLSVIANWEPIGGSPRFTGTFDGDFHAIRNMTINSAAMYAGLFGAVNGQSVIYPTPVRIKNVRLENVDITTTNPDAQAGGLAGAISDHARSEGIYVSGTIRGTGYAVGGIAASIRNGMSYSEAHVEIDGSYRNAGGLAGVTGGGAIIEQSYATGDVHTSGEAAGGLVGYTQGMQAINSYASGNVTLLGGGLPPSNISVGGLLGLAVNTVTLTNSYASGNVVTDIGRAGGLVGSRGFILPPSIHLNHSYWNDTHASLTTIGGESDRSGAVSASGMLEWNTYDGWDSAIWGIRDGESLPYLKRFEPEVHVATLSSNYGTSAPGNELAVNMTVRDGSIGEPLEVRLTLNNEQDATVADAVYTFHASGLSQPIEEWSVTFDELQYPAGRYHLIVTVEDSAHVWERTFFFDINDTSAPAVPVWTSPANGASWNDTTPTISGTAEPGSTVTITLDGSDAGTVIVAAGGTWTWTPTTALSEGGHTVQARAADAAGNVSVVSAARTFTVDMTAPVITLQGSATMSILTGDAFVDPGATAEDGLDGDVSVSVTGHVDNQTPGTYELTYSAQDGAGNPAQVVTRTVRVNARSFPVSYSGNADLKQLTVTADGVEAELTPLFAPETTRYKLETTAEQVDVQPDKAQSGATVTLKEERLPASGIWTLALAEGENLFDIKVTAENGNVKTYRLTIVRLANPEQPPVSPEPAACMFRDIAGHWAEDPICEAAELGLVEGEDAGLYHPQRQVTRIEFAAMLLRTLGLSSKGEVGVLTFGDAERIPDWGKNVASSAVKAGILEGYLDGTLRPLQSVSRAEMAAMLARALEPDFDGEAVAPFADDAAIPDWARANIYAAARHGLLFGRGEYLFVPDGLTTRAEAAVTALRVWHLLR